MVRLLVALLPVLAFLAALLLMDSFKLLTRRSVLQAIAAGAAAALVAARLHGAVIDAWPLSGAALSRYVAPLTEEALKALWVVWLVRRDRVGFLVDAAILGFAVGTGFALVENVEYLRALAEPRMFLWIVRGFGTAVLHGATTAILALVAKAFADRHPERPLTAFGSGLLTAAALHSLFNHFVLPPLAQTGLLLLALPLALLLVFERSEQATRHWLGVGLDGELELLESILSGEVLTTRIGRYLKSLKARFPGEAVADMLCLLRIHLELAIRAKGLMLARESGLAMPVGEDALAKLRELHYLEGSIGRTGLLAVKPILRRSTRDLWQIYKLEEAGA
ncbi:MAG TPA: PrsW family glutamic-type intramembrane protease [Vicinamibacteria bacterium]|nr:PrsW family glutamic-type intramembrane protease [Vicinamibacteria bacterium]